MLACPWNAPKAYSLDTSMLLRTVPLEVSGYTEADGLDQKVQTADSTLELMTTTAPLLVHMEALRRAYGVFGSNTEETQKLLSALKDRYMKEPENANKFFDYGYAQLVMEGNKNGLFFLRKANDKLASPITSLAYGLAQVDIDLIVENGTPDAMTTRKMDAMYKLKDAITFNKEDLLPGVWPSYIHILEGLKPLSAYESLVNEDVTTIYVPYGNASLAAGKSQGNQLMALESSSQSPAPETASPAASDTATEASPAVAAQMPDVDMTCNVSTASPNWSDLAQSRSMDLMNDGKSESINFFNTKPGSPYDVKVMNHENHVIGEFTSYKAPYIAEDLDGDGKYELVVRQFEQDHYHPLYVYRWNGSCYGLDKRVSSFFK